MKKIILLLPMVVLLFSCSNDDSIIKKDEQAQTEQTQTKIDFPTNLNLSVSKAKIDDQITINGEGFEKDAKYVITFSENKIAEIKQIKPNSIEIQVPKGAISGAVSLKLGAESTPLGNITIIASEKLAKDSKLYAFSFTYHELFELDIHSRNQIRAVHSFDTGESLIPLGYDEAQKEIIAVLNVYNVELKNYSDEYVRINPIDGSMIRTPLPEAYQSIVVANTGELYAYTATNEIVKLNTNDASIAKTIVTLNKGDFKEMTYLEKTNKLILLSGNNYTTINPIDGTFDSFSSEEYTRLIPSFDGKVYAYKGTNKMVELNPDNGTEIKEIGSFGDGYFKQKPIYLEKTKEFIIQKEVDVLSNLTNKPALTQYLVKMNVTNGQTEDISSIKYDSFIATNF